MKYVGISTFIAYIYISIFWIGLFVITWLLKRYSGSVNHSLKNSKLGFLLFEGISFSFLGLTLGFLVGLSRAPIADAFIPAFFTFLSGFAIFLFTRKDSDQMIQSAVRARVLILILALSISIFIGTTEGGHIRILSEVELDQRKHLMELEKKEMDHLLKVDYESSLKDSLGFEEKRRIYNLIYERYRQKEVISFDELSKELGIEK